MFAALKRLTRPAGPPPAVPDGLRVYAIGDIHGRADLLRDLLGQIDRDDQARPPAETHLIFVGDLIDRGPASAEVVDLVMAVAEKRPFTRLLMGNHEEVFLRVLDGEVASLSFFLRIGGVETLLSYGLTPAQLSSPDDVALMEAVQRAVPDRHRRFLAGFDDIVVAGDYAFVHAGIRPGIAIDEQASSDLRWIRAPFLNHRGTLEHVVVHGHTISEAVEERPHRIGIDTGAYYSGKLTAIGLEGTDRWYLST